MLAAGLRAADADRVALYLTSRGITNEVYYAAAKAARALGMANIDSAARVCHAPSTVGLRQTVGRGRHDVLVPGRDRGAARRAVGHQPGQQPAGVHEVPLPGPPAGLPGRGGEPVPRAGARPLLGAVQRRVGAVRHEDERPPRAGAARRRRRPGQRGAEAAGRAGRRRRRLRRRPHRGLRRGARPRWRTRTLDDLLRRAGVERRGGRRLRRRAGAGPAVPIHVWSMGITQHRDVGRQRAGHRQPGARPGRRSGRDGVGLMPIRGHSGVQGGAEMGAYATALPGGRARSTPSTPPRSARLWGFPVPDRPGARRRPRWSRPPGAASSTCCGCRAATSSTCCPTRPTVEAALGRVPLRVHQDVVLTSQMLVDGDDVVLLPGRHPLRAGGRRHRDHHRAAHRVQPRDPRRVGEARSEWRLFADVVSRVRPDLPRRRSRGRATATCGPRSPRSCRCYAGIEDLADTGDAVQWGGRHLCAGGAFPTPVGPRPVQRPDPAGRRRPRRAPSCCRPGGASSSTRWSTAAVDPLTGAGRDAVMMDPADAEALGVRRGRPGRLRSATGSYEGTVTLVRLPARTLQVHWPEGNVLIAGGPDRREPLSKVPDYNAVVTVEPLRAGAGRLAGRTGAAGRPQPAGSERLDDVRAAVLGRRTRPVSVLVVVRRRSTARAPRSARLEAD